MKSRDLEFLLLERCASVARGEVVVPENQQEANVFLLASMVLGADFSRECNRLRESSDLYFSWHPGEKLEPDEVVRRGYVIGLPRLRDMLSRKLKEL